MKKLIVIFLLILLFSSIPVHSQSWNVSYVGQLDGFCAEVATDGNYVYSCRSSRSIFEIIDVQNPAFPFFVSQAPAPGYIYSITISSNMAFIANGSTGIRILDISNPVSPQEIGYFNTPGTAMDVAISGNYAYVADHLYGLRVIDVSNPASPHEVGAFTDTRGGQVTGVDVSGNYAYISQWEYSGGLHVIDISNPTNPFRVGECIGLTQSNDVVVSGISAYLIDGASGVLIFNISNPANPQRVYWNNSYQGYKLAISGNYLLVLSHGLRVLDVSYPGNTQEVGFYDTFNPAGVYDVAVSGAYAFLAYGSYGMVIVQNDLVNSIDSTREEFPAEFELNQNYPNPFNSNSTIEYKLPVAANVQLSVFDLLGKKVAELVNEEQIAGSYKISWDAGDHSSGVYLYRMQANDFSQVRKMLLVR